MLRLQARGIGVVRLDSSEVLDPSGEIGTGRQVLSSIAIALLPPLGQREIDHRPQRHRRGQGMLLCQGLGRRDKEFVVNRPGFTGGQNSRRIAYYGTSTKEEVSYSPTLGQIWG